jgi:hypothetical protein
MAEGDPRISTKDRGLTMTSDRGLTRLLYHVDPALLRRGGCLEDAIRLQVRLYPSESVDEAKVLLGLGALNVEDDPGSVAFGVAGIDV